jgi:predicted secreted protein with PEFG-CTERM motif
MLKIGLLALLAISIPMSAFAESSIELSSEQSEINALDSVLVIGKITDVSTFKPIKLTVIAPDGEIVYAPDVPFDDNGVFKRLIHPTLPSFKQGEYTIIASHEDTEKTAKIQFTVTGESKPIPTTQPPEVKPDQSTPSAINLTTSSSFGDDTIIIKGNTTSTQTDLTFRITSPNGNLVSIAQVTPEPNGEFSLEVKTGGPLWIENGMYVITANQGLFSEHERSIHIEIENGVVVPEFGAIAVVILAVAIMAIIAISVKSKVNIFPRY